MVARWHIGSSQRLSCCDKSLRVPVQQHRMLLRRPLGDATPPTVLAKRLRCPAGSQVFARKEEGLVTTTQMVPTFVVRAEHRSGIYHIRVGAVLLTKSGDYTNCGPYCVSTLAHISFTEGPSCSSLHFSTISLADAALTRRGGHLDRTRANAVEDSSVIGPHHPHDHCSQHFSFC
jgi:hypothetical protein